MREVAQDVAEAALHVVDDVLEEAGMLGHLLVILDPSKDLLQLPEYLHEE